MVIIHSFDGATDRYIYLHFSIPKFPRDGIFKWEIWNIRNSIHVRVAIIMLPKLIFTTMYSSPYSEINIYFRFPFFNFPTPSFKGQTIRT